VRIVMSGSSGLIGTALVDHLRSAGHHVVRLTRGNGGGHGPDTARWDPASGDLSPDVVDGADAVINLSGAGIGDHRWTDDYRRELLESRTRTTGLLARTIAGVDRRPAVFISGSAIGWYGDRDDEELDETSTPGTGFLADLCRQWEAATAPAEDAGVRTVHIRTGIVLSARGGALKKQLPLFKLGLGGRFGNGRQWQSWISIDDEVDAITHLLTSELAGAVNLTAPAPVTNREFAKVLSDVLHRPAFLRIPSIGPKLLLGGELAAALLFSGQRVLPARLLADGFPFRHPTLVEALTAMLGDA
jgi:uncharacterized protein